MRPLSFHKSLRNQRTRRQQQRFSRQRPRRPYVEPLEERRLLATITWDGEGADNNWWTAENWFNETNGINDIVPGGDDDVEIRVPFAGIVIDIDRDTLVNTLHSAAGLNIDGGMLRLTSDSQVDGPVDLNGTIAGLGTLTVTDSMNWIGRTMQDGGTTVIADTATLTMPTNLAPGNPSLSDSRMLENFGTITWSNEQNFTMDGPTILNHPGALFDIQNQNDTVLGSISGQFQNAGEFRKSPGGSLTITSALDNTGTIDVQTSSTIDTMLVRGGGTSTGDIFLADDTTLEFAPVLNRPYTISLPADKSITGAGTVKVSNHEASVQGDGTVDVGAIQVSGSGSSLLSLNLDASASRVEVAIGNIGGSGTLTVTDSMNWTSGGMQDSGATAIADTATMTIDQGNFATLSLTGRTLENFGTITWKPGASNSVGWNIVNSNIVNRQDALFDIQSDKAFGGNDTVSQLQNEGTLRKSASSGTSVIGTDFNNTGTIDLQSGTVQFVFGHAGTSSGHFLLADDTTLEFNTDFAITLPADKSILGNGTLKVTRGTTTIQGEGTVDVGAIEISGVFSVLELVSDVVVPDLILANGATLLGSGTLTVSNIPTDDRCSTTTTVLASWFAWRIRTATPRTTHTMSWAGRYVSRMQPTTSLLITTSWFSFGVKRPNHRQNSQVGAIGLAPLDHVNTPSGGCRFRFRPGPILVAKIVVRTWTRCAYGPGGDPVGRRLPQLKFCRGHVA